MIRLLFFLIIIFFSLGTAFAKPQIKPVKYKSYKSSKKFKHVKPKLYMTNKKFKKYMRTKVPKEKRFVASEASYTEKNITSEATTLIDKLLNTKTADKLGELIDHVDANYENYKNQDTKFLAALISPAKRLRGITYKLRVLFETSKSTHSAAVTGIRFAVGLSSVYLSQDHWQAGVDFTTTPSPKDITVFNNIDDLLAFNRDVFQDLTLMKERISKLDFSGTNKIFWDNRIFSGSKTFGDNLDRFRIIGEADRLNVLAAISNNLYAIAMSQAYDIKDILAASDRLGKLIGLDKITRLGSVSGVTTKDRVEAIGESKDLFTLKQQKWIKQDAYTQILDATRFSRAAWEITKKAPDNQWALLDPAITRLFQRQTNMSFETMDRMLSGRTTVRSNVNGKTLEVNLKNFFMNPPQSLQDFLPIEKFNAGLREIPIKGTNLSYRNYRYGTAKNWNINAYAPYFPKITNEKIPEAASILSQTWGAWALAAPLSLVF